MPPKEKTYFPNSDIFTKDKQNLSRALLYQNYSAPVHTHEFYEINVVLGGSGEHLVENSALQVKKGDVFVIPPDVAHAYFCTKELEVLHLLVTSEFISRYRAELEGTPGFKILFNIEPQLRQVTGGKYFMRIDYDMQGPITVEADKMQAAFDGGCFEYLNVLALKLICDLSVKMHQSLTCVSKTKNGREEIICVMEYIQNNLDRKLCGEELAKLAYMSKATLNRNFKKMLGISPNEYIIACRVQKARTLLGESTLNKTQIAQACGFYDLSHMDKYLNGTK